VVDVVSASRTQASRVLMQQLTKTCTMPETYIQKTEAIELVEALRAAPLYAASVRRSLATSLELFDQAMKLAQGGSGMTSPQMGA
jgi:hypothetical protein